MTFQERRMSRILGLVILSTWVISGTITAAAERLSAQRYRDPKGYFQIVPPADWKIQQYVNDPRGKVAFLGPEPGVDLGVLTNPVKYSSIDSLENELKGIERRIGLHTRLERVEFNGEPAIKRFFDFKGLKILAIDFLVDKIDHNLQYSALPTLYQKYLSVAMRSMETYEPIYKSLSEQEHTLQIIAKKIRLAQLLLESNNRSLALQTIKEGLEFDPENTELKALQRKAEE